MLVQSCLYKLFDVQTFCPDQPRQFLHSDIFKAITETRLEVLCPEMTRHLGAKDVSRRWLEEPDPSSVVEPCQEWFNRRTLVIRFRCTWVVGGFQVIKLFPCKL